MKNHTIYRTVFLVLLTSLFLSNPIMSQSNIGDYEGIFYADTIHELQASAQVVGEGGNYYRIILSAISDNDEQEGICLELNGIGQNRQISIYGRMGGYPWQGNIQEGNMTVQGGYGQRFELQRIEKQSPTEGMEPPENGVILLPYTPDVAPDMSAWSNPNWAALDDGSMRIVPGSGSNQTIEQFGDIEHLHIEFKLPNESRHLDQYRCNSGIILAETYEIQVLDSYGVFQTAGDCGAIYNIERPLINASFPPNIWQTYDITFKAPEMDTNGEIVTLPKITVLHNGVKIHDNLEIPYPTANRNRPHKARGPISLQHHDVGHNIQFRNIWLIKGE